MGGGGFRVEGYTKVECLGFEFDWFSELGFGPANVCKCGHQVSIPVQGF